MLINHGKFTFPLFLSRSIKKTLTSNNLHFNERTWLVFLEQLFRYFRFGSLFFHVLSSYPHWIIQRRSQLLTFFQICSSVFQLCPNCVSWLSHFLLYVICIYVYIHICIDNITRVKYGIGSNILLPTYILRNSPLPGPFRRIVGTYTSNLPLHDMS